VRFDYISCHFLAEGLSFSAKATKEITTAITVAKTLVDKTEVIREATTEVVREATKTITETLCVLIKHFMVIISN
jgi:hypothetical protein